jgi:hypothetical protein
MKKTLTAVFDGQVLHPDSTLELKPNSRYVITIENTLPEATSGDAWDVLEGLAGTIEAPPDWSGEHDYYLYGTPKRELQTGADSADE